MDTLQDLNKIKDAKNRYRFRRLQERIDDTKIAVSRDILADFELELHEDADNNSLAANFFRQELQLLIEADRGEEFKTIYKKLQPYTYSLPLILHNLEIIVETLVQGLTSESKSAITVLKAFTALAKDSQAEIFPYLTKMFDAIFGILVTNNVPLCEQIFKTSGSILLELSSEISKRDSEFGFFKKQLIFLIAHRREHIRRFAGEMLGPVIRQMSANAINRMCKKLILGLAGNNDALNRDEQQVKDISDGVARVILNIIRNVQGELHANAESVFDYLFKTARTRFGAHGAAFELIDIRFTPLERMLYHLFDYQRKGVTPVLWRCLFAQWQPMNCTDYLFAKFCDLMTYALRYRRGARITTEVIMQTLRHIEASRCKSKSLPDFVFTRVIRMLVYMALVEMERESDMLEQIVDAASQILVQSGPDMNSDVMELIAEDLCQLENVSVQNQMMLPLFQHFSNLKSVDGSRLAVLSMMSQFILPMMTSDAKLKWPCAIADASCKLLLSKDTSFRIPALNCFQYLCNGNSKFENALVEYVQTEEIPMFRNRALLVLASYAKWDASTEHAKLRVRLVESLLKNMDAFLNEGKSLGAFMDVLNYDDGSYTSLSKTMKANLHEYAAQVADNLMNPSHLLRLNSLRYLKYLEDANASRVEGGFNTFELLSVLIELEQLPVDFDSERKRQGIMNNLEMYVRLQKISADAHGLLGRFLLGQFYVKYSPVWNMTLQILETLSQGVLFERYLWEALWLFMMNVCSKENGRWIESDQASLNLEEDQNEGDVDEEDNDSNNDNYTSHLKEMDDRGVATSMAVFESLFKFLVSSARKVEPKAQQIYCLFFKFLKVEYYALRDDLDDPGSEAPEYVYLEEHSTLVNIELPQTNRRTSRMKLGWWLQLFSRFTKFRDPTLREFTRSIATRFLISTDSKVQTHSLDCLVALRLEFAVQNKSSLMALASEDKFRDEMTTIKFDDVPERYRMQFAQIVTRLLYARLDARFKRTNKDKFNTSSRRAAILGFFSGLTSDQLVFLMELTFRVFPTFDFMSSLKRGVTLSDMKAFKLNDDISRVVAYLNMVEEIINQLGYNVERYLDTILCSLFSILSQIPQIDKSRGAELRGLVLRRFTDFFGTFKDFEMTKWAGVFEREIAGIMNMLVPSIQGATSPPITLHLVAAISKCDELCIWALNTCPSILVETINCLDVGMKENRGACPAIVDLLMKILCNLMVTDKNAKKQLVAPHVPSILDKLVVRLQCSAGGSTLSKHELTILKFIADAQITQQEHFDAAKSQIVGVQLIDLMLPYVQFTGGYVNRPYKFDVATVEERRAQFASKPDSRCELLHIMSALGNTLLRNKFTISLKDAHYVAFSKLLGVLGNDAMYDATARNNLLGCFQALFPVCRSNTLVEDLNAWSKSRLDIYDFDRRLKAYEKMGVWDLNAAEMYPLCHQAVLDLEDGEFPIRSAALYFLTSAVVVKKFMDPLVLDILIPAVKRGVSCSSGLLRKGFVQLLRAIVKLSTVLPDGDIRKENMFGDLIQIINEEDLELDFFTSIVHVQTYRQSKCLATVRNALSDRSLILFPNTLMSIMIPLALEILLTSSKEKDAHMKEEGSAFIGKAAAFLAWDDYFSLLRNLLNKINEHPTLEKRILRAICSVIENFHFESEAEQNPLIMRAVDRFLIPKLERYMKQTSASKHESLRTHVAVAIVMLIKKSVKTPGGNGSLLGNDPKALANLARILGGIVDVLKSVDISARHGARETLVRVAEALGVQSIPVVIEAMKSRMVEGFQCHVYGYSMFYLLRDMLPAMIEDLKRQRLLKKQYVPQVWFGKSRNAINENTMEVDNENGTTEVKIESEDEIEEELDASEAPQESIESLLNIEVCDGIADEILPVYISIIEDELFGELGKQKAKDSEYHSRVRRLVESQSTKAYEMIELLAKSISFLPSPSIHVLLKPILERISTSTDTRELRTAEECMRRIALGLSENQDVRIPQMLVYIHHLISEEYAAKRQRVRDTDDAENGLVRNNSLTQWIVSESEIESKRARSKVQSRNAYADIHIVERAPQLTGRDRFELVKHRTSSKVINATRKANRHLVTGHALGLLLRCFKNKRLRASHQEHRFMLEPFVELLLPICNASKASSSTVLALRALTVFARWKLANFHTHREDLAKCLFKILQKVGFSTSQGGGGSSALHAMQGATLADTAQECMRTLTQLLDHCTYFRVSDEQLKLLVLVCQHSIELDHRQMNTLTLLRAIVNRKLVVTEIYDIMDVLTKLVFTAKSKNARQMCCQILVQFLVLYPLSQKRLRQQLDIIVGNLDYANADGREFGLGLLRKVIDQFPQEIVDDIAQYIFMHLVTRLENEEDSRVARIVSETIKALLGRVLLDVLNTILEIVGGWIAIDESDVDTLLLSAGVRVLGLVAESSNGANLKKKQIETYLKSLQTIIETYNVNSVERDGWLPMLVEKSEKRQNSSWGWHICYHAIGAFHKILLHCKVPGSMVGYCISLNGPDGNNWIQSQIIPIGRYFPHPWVQLACLRLLGELFGRLEPENIWSRYQNESLFSKSGLFVLSQMHTAILDQGGDLDEAIAEQLVKNLVWVFRVLVLNDKEISLVNTVTMNLEHDEESDDEGGSMNESTLSKQQSCFNWLLHRLSFIARMKHGDNNPSGAYIRQNSVFKLFAFAVTLLSSKQNVLDHYLMVLMAPLVRVTLLDENGSQSSALSAVASLGREVLALIEQSASAARYVQVYSDIQTRVQEKRAARKRKLVMEKITDPAAASARKQAKHARKRKHSKTNSNHVAHHDHEEM